MSLQAADPALILASASDGRARLLAAAGLTFDIAPSAIDETEIKRSAAAENMSVEDTALLLSEMKGRRISRRFPEALVIGADQILVCEGRHFDKPGTIAEARDHLRALRGRTHRLVTAVICQRGGSTVWHHVATPLLTMRAFSDEWLERYLEAACDDVPGCVGGYRIESLGLHCFSAIDGEQASIVGLPMLALLGFLRQHGVLRS